jgi:aryl-alcohol dehydrogenase-like predicted oxidoreductase
MEQREIGQCGITVSVIGLGCNNFGILKDARQARDCVHQALDAGITFFDMASEHGAGAEEQLVAAALRGRREQVVIATKVGQPELLRLDVDGPIFSSDPDRCGLSRRWIMRSVEESLTRLGTDYIDIYQPHLYDPNTPREETLTALDDIVRQGKVRAIGEAANQTSVDAFASSQQLAVDRGLTPFSSMQAQYNLLSRDAETDLMPQLRKWGSSLIPYAPLANGLLTGKYAGRNGYPENSRMTTMPFFATLINDRDWDTLDAIRTFAADHYLAMTQLAIAWLLAQPIVASVIAGATRPEQVIENATAAATILTVADLAELDELTRRHA